MARTREAAAGPSPRTSRRGLRRLVLILLPGVAALLSGCGAYGHGTAEATPLTPMQGASSPAAASSAPSATRSIAGRSELPSAFPVPAGAESQPLPADDPSVIARWTLDAIGSGPYDYFVEALPAAGYPIVGRYPAEQAALVRFEVAPGTIWQLVLEREGGGTRVTVQTDRP